MRGGGFHFSAFHKYVFDKDKDRDNDKESDNDGETDGAVWG
jgi:hypothetical protein